MTTPTHRAIATTALNTFDEIQVPTERPGAGQILIKHAYGGMIAFDGYQTDLGYFVEKYPHVLGFSASGVVAEVGSGVSDFAAGDRVTAYTFNESSRKALQQYSVQPGSAVGKIPHSLPLPEAATIPDNFVTAFYTLFNQLGLPMPDFPVLERPPSSSAPILVYGAGAISGQYMVQLLHAAGYRNIIATASAKHHDYIHSLGATSVFDYRSPTLKEDIAKAAAGDGFVQYAVDCISSQTTIEIISRVISPSGTLAFLLPIKEGTSVTGAPGSRMVFELPEEWNVLPKTTKIVYVRTFIYDQDEFLRDNLMPKILPKLLEAHLIKPSKILLLDEGSFRDRVDKGLDLLRNNKVSGEKVIIKID